MDLHRQCHTSCPTFFTSAIAFRMVLTEAHSLIFKNPLFLYKWLVDFCEQLPKERFVKPIRTFKNLNQGETHVS